MTGKSEDRDRFRPGGRSLDAASEAAVLRWLAGEMDGGEARDFEARLAADPALARAAEARRRTWRRLEVPASAPGEGVPPGFAGRVMAQVREEAGRGRAAAAGRGPLSAAWSRAAGAAALAGGLALGLGLAQVAGPGAPEVPGASRSAGSADPAGNGEPLALSRAYGDLYSGLAAGSEADTATAGSGTGGTLAADYAAALGELAGGEGT